MSYENISKFFIALHHDEQKRSVLESLNKQYAGQQIDDETRMDVIRTHILPLAEKLQMPFTIEELQTYSSKQSKSSGALDGVSLKELDSVVGGLGIGSICVGLGLGLSIGDGLCTIIGFSAFG
ncbi:hypothetical protein [Thiorhodovibrio frisius]|uniref:Nif11 domain-containing protein n=1 Tax=Thiorhodovibrio frisius TaxID=631362 RepID=H8Z1L9_9GAMM|nr:hypothetical protein [Thiorhodovibrio frisius]EIC21464.1 hypothetical protein Thi970DRAFT_01674 [Thiorhodovibrio frisius]WPL24050.1 hypothetical protein Thiofri_04262 [Thiorhodovibrio frisius]